MMKLNDDLIKRLGVLTDKDTGVDLGTISTGSLALNYVISGRFDGGYPIGRLIEIYGEASTGKTVLLTHAIKSAQEKGYYTCLLDNEFSYSEKFAQALGVDSSKLIYDTPNTVPKCFKKATDWIEAIRAEDKETPILICLDSLAGQSTIEDEKDIGQLSPTDGARRALEIGQALRQIRPILIENKVCLIVINQTRVNLGVVYGDNTAKAGGGKSLEFWTDVSLKTQSNKTSDIIKEDNVPVGIKGTIKNRKNKVHTPFMECEFKLVYNKGLDLMYGVLPLLVAEKKLTKNGGWYALPNGGKKFQESDFYEGKVDLTEVLGPINL